MTTSRDSPIIPFIFAFSYDPETKKAVQTGNISLKQALDVLQEIVLQDMLNQLKQKQEIQKT